jgi:hypothetical protein
MTTRTIHCTLVVLAAASFSLSNPAVAATQDQNAKCALLTPEEIEKAIGSHDGGKSDLGNQWSLQGCRWTATAPKKGAPAGWHDSVEVAVFDPLRTSWAREQATGDPVPGMTGAKFDASYANLWFDCAGARVCVVNVRTASSAGREETAKRLAQAVARRLKP